MARGITTYRSRCVGLRFRAIDASAWPLRIARMEPRAISVIAARRSVHFLRRPNGRGDRGAANGGGLIIQNGESTQLDWLAFHFEAPLWIMLPLTLIAGGVIADAGKVVGVRSLANAEKRRKNSGPKPATRRGRKA